MTTDIIKVPNVFAGERVRNGGRQIVIRFPNGFGASVVQHSFSYGGDQGLWELAVLRTTSEDPWDIEITYSTPITPDVIGWLDEADVIETLERIAQLPAAHHAARRELEAP